MFETSRLAVTPEDAVTEFNQLYLEKCKEVNKLEQLLYGQRAMLEERGKEIDSLKSRLKETEAAYKEVVEKNEKMKADWIDAAICNMRTAPMWETWMAAAEPVEAPECLLEEKATAQDILCLSSALKNLFEIHKCDSFALYIKLSRVLEKKIEEYCKEEG